MTAIKEIIKVDLFSPLYFGFRPGKTLRYNFTEWCQYARVKDDSKVCNLFVF